MQQAVCVRRKQNGTKTRDPAAPKHHEIHSSPATMTTSRRPATKHVPRISLYLPASIDPRFVQIGLVRLSQPVKNTNVPYTHPGTSREVNEARRPHTCSRPCAFEEEKKIERKKNTNNSAPPKTPRYPQQPGNRDHLKTARDETRPTR